MRDLGRVYGLFYGRVRGKRVDVRVDEGQLDIWRR